MPLKPREVRLEQNHEWLVYLHARFWGKVDVRSANECWRWQAKIIWSGYGCFSVALPGSYKKNFTTGAHRVAWMLTHGSIPDGMTVDHLCTRRDCANPGHMRLLSLADNVREAKWRKRAARS